MLLILISHARYNPDLVTPPMFPELVRMCVQDARQGGGVECTRQLLLFDPRASRLAPGEQHRDGHQLPAGCSTNYPRRTRVPPLPPSASFHQSVTLRCLCVFQCTSQFSLLLNGFSPFPERYKTRDAQASKKHRQTPMSEKKIVPDRTRQSPDGDIA